MRIVEECAKLLWKPFAQLMSRNLLFTLDDVIVTFEILTLPRQRTVEKYMRTYASDSRSSRLLSSKPRWLLIEANVSVPVRPSVLPNGMCRRV